MTLPILNLASLDSRMIVRRGDRMLGAEFVAAVESLIERLPPARHVINLCERRGNFLLGFASALVRGQLTLLPPNQSPGTLSDLLAQFSECVVLDDVVVDAALGQRLRAMRDPGWRIEPERVVALTFTSGSTGTPQQHPKTWRTLYENSRLAAQEVLGGLGVNLVATVPAQHVYGLETSAISVFAAGCAVFDTKAFFARDVAAALDALDAPRTLVTTPTHLRNLLSSKIVLPSLQRVVSATAPLGRDLAERIEAAWRTEVHEIYGCTEAGIVAHRRTIEGDRWRTFSNGSISIDADVAYYRAPQLPTAIALQDRLELKSPEEFDLLGRAADMIKVAGKRMSLQALTQMMLDIDGVQDAVVFVPEADARPVAFAVAPALDSARILDALRARVDPVFLPRPLLILEQLPRNAVGKLTQDALLRILRKGSA